MASTTFLVICLWIGNAAAVVHHEQVSLVRSETPTTVERDVAGNHMEAWLAAPEAAKWPAIPDGEVREMLEGWYKKYGDDLEKVRARAREWPGHPQTDDLEMSISYLRLRATAPKVVWECAPADGWSSLFILQALKDNGHGHLYSFGLEKEKTVFTYMNKCCSDLSALWSYREGYLQDFTGKYDFQHGKGGFKDSKGYVEVPMPDYVYMDALHTYDFGKMYADVLLSKLNGHAHVSMHDAFRDGWSHSTAQEKQVYLAHPKRPMPEAEGVIDTLNTKICRGFTVSKSYRADFQESVKAIHDKYVHSKELWGTHLNPTFWFELGCAPQ